MKKNFKQIIEELLPNARLEYISYGTNENEQAKWNHFSYFLHPGNNQFVGSPYFFTGKRVVHFTSIQALLSIIESQSIRLYNLYTLNDPREFTFASNVFRIREDLIKDAKDNLFIISFCEEDALNETANEFNMWRLYGLQGKGAAIVFSFTNDPMQWLDFHLSKVIYGGDSRKTFKSLFQELQNQSNETPSIDVDLGKLYAFHKSNLFSYENEVRLLFDRRKLRLGMTGRTIKEGDNIIFPKIQRDILRLADSEQNIQFLELPIYRNSSIHADNFAPLIKIEKIILGYNVKNSSDLIDLIGQSVNKNFDFPIKIEQTRLAEYYTGIRKGKLIVHYQNVNPKHKE